MSSAQEVGIGEFGQLGCFLHFSQKIKVVQLQAILCDNEPNPTRPSRKKIFRSFVKFRRVNR